MKGKISNKAIALCGIGGAISIIMIVLSYYIPNLSLTFNILASIGVMLPLAKNYYKEGIFLVIAVSLLGLILVNIKILPFVLVTGTYTYFTLYINNKKFKNKKINITFFVIIKILYASAVFFTLYKLAGLITVDFSEIDLKIDKTLVYLILNILFVIGFFIYDSLVLYGFEYLKKYIK